MKPEEAQTVLIIHNSPELISAVSHPLRQIGCRVLTAPDSQAGLEVARREPPDLIISDEFMLGDHGNEYCLWRDDSFRAIPLLLISSQKPDDACALKCQANVSPLIEADDDLAAPLAPLLLLAKVTRLLERKRGEEALRKEPEAVGLLGDVAAAATRERSPHHAILP